MKHKVMTEKQIEEKNTRKLIAAAKRNISIALAGPRKPGRKDRRER